MAGAGSQSTTNGVLVDSGDYQQLKDRYWFINEYREMVYANLQELNPAERVFSFSYVHMEEVVYLRKALAEGLPYREGVPIIHLDDDKFNMRASNLSFPAQPVQRREPLQMLSGIQGEAPQYLMAAGGCPEICHPDKPT